MHVISLAKCNWSGYKYNDSACPMVDNRYTSKLEDASISTSYKLKGHSY